MTAQDPDELRTYYRQVEDTLHDRLPVTSELYALLKMLVGTDGLDTVRAIDAVASAVQELELRLNALERAD